MPSLEEILSHKRMEVEALKARLRRAGSTTVMKGVGQVRSVRQAISGTLSGKGMAIIPELKKADPWRGVLHDRYQAIQYAHDLFKAGAPVLAMQTDTRYFGGSIEELYSISRRVKVPMVMRDFIVDEAQITEGKAKGADAVVLTAGLLEKEQLAAYIKFADYIWMESIVEVSKADELEMALNAGAKMIGVQNRDLHSQTIQIERTLALKQEIPKDVTSVVVGGISEPADITTFRDAGFEAAVIGDMLMRAKSLSETYTVLAAQAAQQPDSTPEVGEANADGPEPHDEDTKPSVG